MVGVGVGCRRITEWISITLGLAEEEEAKRQTVLQGVAGPRGKTQVHAKA